MKNYSVLPSTFPFSKLALPYLVPYILYTGMGMFSEIGVPEWGIQVLKFASVTGSLIYFRDSYRIGRPCFKYALLSLAVTPILLAAWIYPFEICRSFANPPENPTILKDLANSTLYFYLRLINSVLLVALFEELFCRGYLMEYFHQVGQKKGNLFSVDHFLSPLDETPSPINQLPFSVMSVIASTLIFTLGHSPVEYISAILYFSLTNLIYWKTKSFWTCIFTHGFTNLTIAGLVRFYGMDFLWF